MIFSLSLLTDDVITLVLDIIELPFYILCYIMTYDHEFIFTPHCREFHEENFSVKIFRMDPLAASLAPFLSFTAHNMRQKSGPMEKIRELRCSLIG